MSYTTRNCEICGKLMIHVDSRRRICRECCIRVRPKETVRILGRTVSKQADLPPKRRIKPITQCVREAEALGISYGQYVQRGYDKITWKKILKLEVL